MTAKMITANPDLIESLITLARAHPLAALLGGTMLLAAVTHKFGF